MKRSKFLLNKYKINPTSVHCPNKNFRGKPFPDQLLNSLKKIKLKQKMLVLLEILILIFLLQKEQKLISFLQNMDMERILNLINIIFQILGK